MDDMAPEMASKDYYDILNVARAATDTEIKKSYRKLAMKWHPDKNPENAEQAAVIFQDIGEAYSVLSDKAKKAVYDQYGYEALRDGVPDEHGGMRGGWSYKQNATEIFAGFFGTSNPFADFGFGDSVPFATRLRKVGPKKMDPILKPLECTLEELFNGCVKKYQVTRKRLVPTEGAEAYADETKTLTIHVKPGWKKNTNVTFAQEGDAAPNVIPADIVFQLAELPHPTFAREGSNLVFTSEVSLAKALVGTIIEVPTLDGRVLSISCPEIISPGYYKTIPGEGMPLSKTPKVRGDLVVRFKIAFPQYLGEAKKQMLLKILS
ncbi:DnaJ domain-containing protein [Pelagophyceae sp. CCMP2097]|nr:DnaJ domain-containing protein [Pelagophyceae sp. CCMP2097]|mmetsp:Transcript_8846/g.29196  ORF Transcript_8846/g.29196 Transcript_8846/m.29196 type:complete len:321 (-) Transcript_8846:101-1063(-)